MITYRNLTQYLEHLSSDSYSPTRIPQVESFREEYRQIQRVILGALEKGNFITEAPTLRERISILKGSIQNTLTNTFHSKAFLRERIATEQPLRRLSRDLNTMEQGFPCVQEGLKTLGQKVVQDMVALRMSMIDSDDEDDDSSDEESLSDEPFGSKSPQKTLVEPVLEKIDVRVPTELPDDFFAPSPVADSNLFDDRDPFTPDQHTAPLITTTERDKGDEFDPFSEDISPNRPLQLVKIPARPSILSLLEQLKKELQKLDIRSSEFTLKCETIKEAINDQRQAVKALESSEEIQTLDIAISETLELLQSRIAERQRMFEAISSALCTIDQETHRLNMQAKNFQDLGWLIKGALDLQLDKIKALPESDQKRDLHLAHRGALRNLVERMEENARIKSSVKVTRVAVEPSIASTLQQISKEIQQLNMNNVHFKAQAGAIGDRLLKLNPKIKALTNTVMNQKLTASFRLIFEDLLKRMEENKKRFSGVSA